MRAVGEGGIAGYGTGSAVVGGVGAAHEAARMASTARGVAASAVANRHMAGDLPGPRSAAFYANRYGLSTGAHSGTPDQLALLQQQRGVQAGIRQSVETPRIGAYHNEDPRALAPLFPRDPHVISGDGRVPTGNPVEARRVVDRAARQARANPGALARAGAAARAAPKAAPRPKAAPARAAPAAGGGKGGGKGAPPWARGAPRQGPGRPKPHMVNPFT